MIELLTKSDWTGNADELAARASEILAARGLADDPVSPNVRLIRDYGHRAIVDKPERRGKEAIYSFRHLLQFVAARALVIDGWPLAKIAQQFAGASDADLIAWIPGGHQENPAVSVARRLIRETGSRSSLGSSGRGSTQAADATPPPQSLGSPRAPDFRERAAQTTSIQNELRDALRRLGLPADAPPAEQVTVIAIAPWCQVLIESKRLLRVTADEADEIGRAITASLLNPTIRKGAM